MRVTNWPNILVDQGPFSDPDFISGTHQSENVQFADKLSYQVRIYGKTTTKVGQLDYGPWQGTTLRQWLFEAALIYM